MVNRTKQNKKTAGKPPRIHSVCPSFLVYVRNSYVTELLDMGVVHAKMLRSFCDSLVGSKLL